MFGAVELAIGRFAGRLLARPLLVVALFLAGGLVALVVYRDLPVVRNALLYARIAYSLIDLGGQFQTAEHAYNKALGFPVLAVPLVWLCGANLGLKLASFLFTGLWAVSAVLFFRRLARRFAWEGVDPRNLGLPTLILLLNPLVFYQLVSAYPDTLSALAIIWALMLLDRMTSLEIRWFDGLAFAAVTLVAIWIKHHGFVILGLLVVFGLCRWRMLGKLWRERRRELAAVVLALVALGALLGLAQTGRVPLFNLSRNQSNYSGGFENLWSVFQINLSNLGNYLLLSFSVLAPLLLRWRALLAHKEWYLTIAILVGTILIYDGARYNMRYFIPVAPLLAWIIAGNLAALGRRFGSWPRRSLLGLFVVLNLLLTVYYNSIAIHDAASAVVALPRHDNLRLTGEQRTVARRIAEINGRVEQDLRTLYFAHSYYRHGTWYVWERDGLFDERLEIVYMRKPYWGRIRKHARQHGVRRAFLYTRRELTTQKKPASIQVEELQRKVYLLRFD